MEKTTGFTLIEVLAALGVASLLVSVITVAVLSALFNAQYSKNQNLATQYAQEGMEIVRKIRNEDFTAFNSLGSNQGISYCLNKNQTTIQKESPGANSSDRRNSTIQGCAKQVGQPGQNVDNFARQVDVARDASRCGNDGTSGGTKVTVSVSWSDSKCVDTNNLFCHQVKLVSCFSDSEVSSP